MQMAFFFQALLGYASVSDLFQCVPHQCIFSTRQVCLEMGVGMVEILGFPI